MDTLHSVAHHHEQAWPTALRKVPKRGHDPRMNALLVGLSQTHDQEAEARLIPVL
jgi:hypothetical protein